MKKQREVLFGDFRKKIQDDDITKLVLMQRQENHKVKKKGRFFLDLDICFLSDVEFIF